MFYLIEVTSICSGLYGTFYLRKFCATPGKNPVGSPFLKKGRHWEICDIFKNSLVLEHLWVTVCEKCKVTTECMTAVNSVCLQRLTVFKNDCSKINYSCHTTQKNSG